MTTLRLKGVVNCEACGKEFHPHAGRRESNRWCSKECFYSMRRIYKTCPKCGKKFYRPKTRPRIFCSRKCWHEANGRTYHAQPTFKGNKHITGRGYVYVLCPDHPSVQGKPYKRVAEHRLVMEKILGRFLHPWEIVHHKSTDKGNNSPENLELWVSGHPNGIEVSKKYVLEIMELKQRISQLESELGKLKE